MTFRRAAATKTPEIKPFEISNHEKQKEKHAAIQFFRSLLKRHCVPYGAKRYSTVFLSISYGFMSWCFFGCTSSVKET